MSRLGPAGTTGSVPCGRPWSPAGSVNAKPEQSGFGAAGPCAPAVGASPAASAKAPAARDATTSGISWRLAMVIGSRLPSTAVSAHLHAERRLAGAAGGRAGQVELVRPLLQGLLELELQRALPVEGRKLARAVRRLALLQRAL